MSDEGEAEIRPLTFHEVFELLDRLSNSGMGFRRSTHRRVYEYVQKFLYAEKEDIEALIRKLEELGIPRKVAIQIAYILPTTPNEVRPFISQVRQMGGKIEDEDTLLSRIIEITSPIWKEKASKIMSLRNINPSDLKKSAKQ